MAYATVDEFKAQVKKEFDSDDSIISFILEAATEAIDNYCNREQDGFVAASSASARQYAGTGDKVVWIDECVAVSLVEVKASETATSFTAWSAGDWIAATGEPKIPDFNSTPYNFVMVVPTGNYGYFPKSMFPIVRVTAKWGYAVSVPEVIKQATITQAARWYKRSGASWADTIVSGDFQQMQFRKALDPDVGMMLRSGRFVRVTV